MPESRTARLVLSGALLALAAGLAVWISDSTALAAVRSGLVLWSAALVVLLLASGVVLSSLRLKLITADLGYPVSFRDAAMTLSVGQLAGTAFFQFAGQLIGRSAVLSRQGVPAAAAVVISGYERVVALSVSLLLAGAGALYLFGTLSLNLDTGGASLIKLGLGLFAVVGAGACLAWGRPVLDLARALTLKAALRLLRSFAISFAIQGTTLAAYVALEMALAPHIGVASLAAASCLIMLAASLPISFGGWGIRELSAVVALQAIGLSSASALLIGLLIGFLSLVVIAGTAAVIMVGWTPGPRRAAAMPGSAAPDYAAGLDWLLPLMAATAVLFQIYIPSGGGAISVNLADPVVILGAALFGLHHIGRGWPAWRVPHANLWVAATSSVIAISLVRGWAAFGWTDWAFINKGLGWLVLLCYAATGALIVRRAQSRGLDLIVKTFAASAAAIASIDIGFTLARQAGIEIPFDLLQARAAGLSQNANAFAFVLTLAFAGAIVLREQAAVRVGLMVVALVGIWLTGSRAGILAAMTVIAAALMMRVAMRPLLKAALLSVLIVLAIGMLPQLLHWVRTMGVAGFGLSAGENLLLTFGRAESSETQHWQTVMDGLNLFAAHPLVGAGLGAYIGGQTGGAETPQVIHSTAVWLLAETGAVGLAVFLAAAWRLFADGLKRRGDPAGLLLVLLLCALAAMSAVHEMLYQRPFWLLLGAVLALPAAMPRLGVRR